MSVLLAISGLASSYPCVDAAELGANHTVAHKVADKPQLLESGGGRYEPPADSISPIKRKQLLENARRMAVEFGVGTVARPVTSKQLSGLPDEDSNRAQKLPSSGARLVWPVRPGEDNRNDFQTGISNYVDLDPNTGSLLDYACGQRTYDLSSGYNHDGIDISSWPYPWTTMDTNGLSVIAAADGTIVSKVGNRPDRSCSFDSPTEWNLIVLAHDDGTQTVYGHLKRDSLTSKKLGDTVSAGDYLGQVGSSGISTGPHLHFEVLDADNNSADPFTGLCGADDTRWRWQPEYNRAGVNAVMTGNFAPELGECYGSEQPHPMDEFAPGDPVFVSGYFVNQRANATAQLELIQPDGSVWLDVAMGNPPQDFDFSYWYRAFIAPAIPGKWRARMTLEGISSESGFSIDAPSEEGFVVAAILPGSRSVGRNQPASIFATIANGGDVPLQGCRVLPLGPFPGQISYQATNPVSNALIGSPNQPVMIGVGQAQSFLVTLEPTAEVVASNIEFNFKCNNAPRARSVRGLNTLQFSSLQVASADILPISATMSGDGVVRLNGLSGVAAFGTAAVNIGASDNDVTVIPSPEGLDLIVSVCETNAVGACKSPPSDSLSADFALAARTFSVFVSGKGAAVPFDPANNRIELRFESDGELRGITSVAVTTE